MTTKKKNWNYYCLKKNLINYSMKNLMNYWNSDWNCSTNWTRNYYCYLIESWMNWTMNWNYLDSMNWNYLTN